MIRYALSCDKGHDFESWFQSGAAYDSLRTAGMVSCPHCGGTEVSKSVMAPMVGRTDAVTAPQVSDQLAMLRAHVEANSDYVGDRFADEARAMYLGDRPERPIYGEARPHEARVLLSEGVPVLPLPFTPRKRTH